MSPEVAARRQVAVNQGPPRKTPRAWKKPRPARPDGALALYALHAIPEGC